MAGRRPPPSCLLVVMVLVWSRSCAGAFRLDALTDRCLLVDGMLGWCVPASLCTRPPDVWDTIVCDELLCCGPKSLKKAYSAGGVSDDADRLPWELYPDCGRVSVAVSYNFTAAPKPEVGPQVASSGSVRRAREVPVVEHFITTVASGSHQGTHNPTGIVQTQDPPCGDAPRSSGSLRDLLRMPRDVGTVLAVNGLKEDSDGEENARRTGDRVGPRGDIRALAKVSTAHGGRSVNIIGGRWSPGEIFPARRRPSSVRSLAAVSHHLEGPPAAEHATASRSLPTTDGLDQPGDSSTTETVMLYGPLTTIPAPRERATEPTAETVSQTEFLTGIAASLNTEDPLVITQPTPPAAEAMSQEQEGPPALEVATQRLPDTTATTLREKEDTNTSVGLLSGSGAAAGASFDLDRPPVTEDFSTSETTSTASPTFYAEEYYSTTEAVTVSPSFISTKVSTHGSQFSTEEASTISSDRIAEEPSTAAATPPSEFFSTASSQRSTQHAAVVSSSASPTTLTGEEGVSPSMAPAAAAALSPSAVPPPTDSSSSSDPFSTATFQEQQGSLLATDSPREDHSATVSEFFDTAMSSRAPETVNEAVTMSDSRTTRVSEEPEDRLTEGPSTSSGGTTTPSSSRDDRLQDSPWRHHQEQLLQQQGSRDGRVFGGWPAPRDTWPWLVSIGERDGEDVLWICGGTLISDLHVLTAAHCVRGRRASSLILKIGEYSRPENGQTDGDSAGGGAAPDDDDGDDGGDGDEDGVAGDDDAVPEPTLSTSEGDAITVTVHRITVHPEHSQQHHDIALLRLSRRVAVSESVRPACLPPPGTDHTGRAGWVAGWGALRFDGRLPTVLQHARLRLLPTAPCEKAYRRTRMFDFHFPGGFGGTKLCAGGEQGAERDACQGDSGGPLVVGGLDGDGERATLVGVISTGKGCGDPNYPGIFTKVSKYIWWIVNNAV